MSKPLLFSCELNPALEGFYKFALNIPGIYQGGAVVFEFSMEPCSTEDEANALLKTIAERLKDGVLLEQ